MQKRLPHAENFSKHGTYHIARVFKNIYPTTLHSSKGLCYALPRFVDILSLF